MTDIIQFASLVQAPMESTKQLVSAWMASERDSLVVKTVSGMTLNTGQFVHDLCKCRYLERADNTAHCRESTR
jgi:hypothetical protein